MRALLSLMVALILAGCSSAPAASDEEEAASQAGDGSPADLPDPEEVSWTTQADAGACLPSDPTDPQGACMGVFSPLDSWSIQTEHPLEAIDLTLAWDAKTSAMESVDAYLNCTFAQDGKEERCPDIGLVALKGPSPLAFQAGNLSVPAWATLTVHFLPNMCADATGYWCFVHDGTTFSLTGELVYGP